MAKRHTIKQQRKPPGTSSNKSNSSSKNVLSKIMKKTKTFSSWSSVAMILSIVIVIISIIFQKDENDNNNDIYYDNGDRNNNDNSYKDYSSAENGIIDERILIKKWSTNSIGGGNVDRIPLKEMTEKKFYNDYLLKRRPFVLEGAYRNSPLKEGNDDGRWSFESIANRYGNITFPSVMIPVQKGHNVNCTMAGLCKRGGDKMTIKEMFDETFLLPLDERRKRAKAKGVAAVDPYPHDLNMQYLLPDMYKVYRKISLFAKENLFISGQKSGGNDKWPSLFFGPTGTKTHLHVDKWGTSFTMAVFRGKKQFVLFDVPDVQYLCIDKPLPSSIYGIDVFNPNFVKCPSAKKSNPLFATLNAGDILYVPGSTHHAAQNLFDSIGVSQNFLFQEDYSSFLEGGPVGYISQFERNRTGNIIPVETEYMALRDLFLLLQQTGYDGADWSFSSSSSSSSSVNANKKPLKFVKADVSTNTIHQRILHHLEHVALKQMPSLCTRVAFLVGVDYIRLALKAARLWDCIEVEARDILFVQPHHHQSDNVRGRLQEAYNNHLVVSEEYNSNDNPCHRGFKQYLDIILDQGIKFDSQDLENEKGLYHLLSSWSTKDNEILFAADGL